MNCLSNDANWAGTTGWNDAHLEANSNAVELEPMSPEEVNDRRKRREVLVTGTALTALLFAVLAILKS